MSMMYDARACRACLKVRGKMFDLHKKPLREYYEDVIGQKLDPTDGLPLRLCVMCAVLARKCVRFREQCFEAQRVLCYTSSAFGQLTVEDISDIDCSSIRLVLNLTCASINVQDSTDSTYVKDENETFTDFDNHVDRLDRNYDSDDEDKPLSLSRTKRVIKIEEDTNEMVLTVDVKEEESVVKNITKKKKTDKKGDVKKSKENHIEIKKKSQRHKEVKLKQIKKRKEGEICVKDVETFATLRVLTHDEQVAEIQKRKETSNYVNSPFKCDLCYKGFVDTGTYKNHTRRHSAECGEFECGVCHVRRSTAHRLRGHVTAVHSRRYTCNTCQRLCTNANQALEHEKWHRGVRHPCQFCDKSFSKWSSRLSHERLRHRSQFVCAACGDAFVSSLGLAQHISRAHKQEAPANGILAEDAPVTAEVEDVYCVECDVHFSTRQAYTRHTLTSDKHGHDATMSTGCRRCGVVFTSEEAWSEHARSHAVRCGRVRKRHYVLPRHGNVSCQECGEEFKAASHCMAHYKTEHPSVKYPAEFVCETCGRKCRNRAVLLYHQRTHTGERPYPCAVCGAAFKHQSNLRRHSRVHTGEKLFECELCCKRFTQKVGKDMHVRTVHEKRPYPRRNRTSAREPAHPLPL